MTKPWAADAFLLASSADCKPHDSDDADMAGPLVLLPPQAEITVEIDDDGNVLLRQECTLGGDPDQIVIARANLSAFLGALIDITPHGRCGFDLGGVPPEWSAEPPTRQPSMPSATPTSAALRQRRHRANKRREATAGEPSTNRIVMNT